MRGPERLLPCHATSGSSHKTFSILAVWQIWQFLRFPSVVKVFLSDVALSRRSPDFFPPCLRGRYLVFNHFPQLQHFQRTFRPVVLPAHDQIAMRRRMHVRKKIAALVFKFDPQQLRLPLSRTEHGRDILTPAACPFRRVAAQSQAAAPQDAA